jgi:Lipopolysaccharide-assembly
MSAIRTDIAAYMHALGLLVVITASLLLGACAPAHLVVAGDPRLARIRTVHVLPFESRNANPAAEAAMARALVEQLQYDGVFRAVEDPQLADAYFQGTVGTWSRGGLDLTHGARSTVISGTLTLLNATKQRLWFAAAVQLDPLRIVTHGLFARAPSALAPYWVRTVLQQLPGYTVAGRPEAQDDGLGSESPR